MLGPLKFRPILKEKVWGGDLLGELAGKDVPPGAKVGESWELSDRPGDASVVACGPNAGAELRTLLEERGQAIYGTGPGPLPNGRFPLLVKFIHAAQPLSAQVHPDDDYCLRNKLDDVGKTECWYILQPPERGVVLGMAPCADAGRFREMLDAGKLEDWLHFEPVYAGDLVYCPAGTMHAALPPMVFAEIQQNSDLTFRVFDWNRVGLDGKPRELHVEKALEVLDFAPAKGLVRKPQRLANAPFVSERMLDCDKFSVERWRFASDAPRGEREEGFEVLMVLEGRGAMEGGGERLPLRRGDTVLIPACLRQYRVSVSDAPLVLLRSAGK